jgi:ABC-type glutathione transport system ATPase component
VQTEREIQRALDNVVAGRTTIAIAHRLSTLAKADLLIVLKDGRVVEQGTHTQLLALGGEYAKLQRAQRQLQSSEPVEVAEEEPEAPEPAALLEAVPDPDLRLRWSSETDTLTLAKKDGDVLVSPRRCFPLTDPDCHVSLVDARGHERAFIARISELQPASRQALLTALAAFELLPRVEQIEALKQEATQSSWTVLTERGPRRFVVEQEDHIRRLADGRHLLTDSHGMRYLLPPLEQLDPRSRKLFAPFS